MQQGKVIGARWFNATQQNNDAGSAVSEARASVTAEQANFFAASPTIDMVEQVALGYLEAATAAGKKSGKTGASQIRKLGANLSAITYKRDDEGAITAFGHGSLTKEYNAVLLIGKSAAERYVLTLQAIDALKQTFADELAALESERDTWREKARAELS